MHNAHPAATESFNDAIVMGDRLADHTIQFNPSVVRREARSLPPAVLRFKKKSPVVSFADHGCCPAFHGTMTKAERANQRNAVLAGFLGWTLDAFDFFILTLVIDDVAEGVRAHASRDRARSR